MPLRIRNGLPLNNNRSNNNNSNNRRRGRGNRNQGGGGGGNQGNRIDSRARGNAPQLLDKYKKLAQDAQHHGDRVQAEYYLQFADHYFRVIADNRTRQDEPRGDQRPDARQDGRGPRRDERDQDDFEIGDQNDGDDRFRYDSRERETQDRDNREREPREPRRERPRREFARDDRTDEPVAVETSEGPSFEPEDNPFARQANEPREDRPKRRAPRARGSDNQDSGSDSGIDVAALPSFLANDAKGAEDEAEEAAPRPRRKRSGGGTLSAVG